MRLSSKILKGGAQVALGQLGQQILLLVRNVFVARLLPEEQFGIALTFMTVLAALDALTEIGIEVYILRSRNIDEGSLQGTLHTMLILRGLIAGLGLFAVADFVAYLFGVPESASAYRWLALVPVIRGFMHLDYKRFERQYRYTPSIIVTFLSVIVNAIVGIGLAWYTRSPFAVVLGSIAQMLVHVAVSHIVAEKKYQILFDKQQARDMMTFGNPLIPNAIMLFAVNQGDKVLVGAKLGLRALENYGVVAILATGIALLIHRATAPIYLPLLSEHDEGSPEYQARFDACGAATTIISIATVAFFAFVGESFIKLAFGAKYEPTALLVTLLGIRVSLKFMRNWPQKAFLANAKTSMLFYSNLIAALGLAMGFVSTLMGYGMVEVATCFVVAEFIAAFHAVYSLYKVPALFRTSLKYMMLMYTFSIGVLAMQWWNLQPKGYVYEVLGGAFFVGLGLAIVLSQSPSLGKFVKDTIKARR